MPVKRSGDGMEKLQIALAKLDGADVAVGWFESARYEDGTPVAQVAATHEFGSPANNIPPRPFMRTTMEERKGAWRDTAEQGAKAILHNNATSEDLMEGIGIQAAGDIQKTISQITDPALKPSTVAARQSRYATKGRGKSPTKPLVDTATLLTTVTSIVSKK